MNKLIIDNIYDLNDVIITEDTELIMDLKNVSDSINIRVMDNICLYVLAFLNNTKNCEVYHVGENSKVVVNKIAVNNNDSVRVDLEKEGANITFNSSMINYDSHVYTETIYHHCSNTTSTVVNHAINVLDNDFAFHIDAIIPKNSDNCNATQDNKIINMGNGKNEIRPNLLVDNHFIEAMHSAYVGQFNKDSIFYLMTRGIPLEEVKDLLALGFLLEKVDLKGQEKDRVTSFIKNSI